MGKKGEVYRTDGRTEGGRGQEKRVLIKAAAEQSVLHKLKASQRLKRGPRNQERAFTYPPVGGGGGGSVLINVNDLMMLQADKFCRRKTHFACRPRTKKKKREKLTG